jgi:vancomycin permeability regulator SanA
MLLAGVLAVYAVAPAWFSRRRWLTRATAIYLLILIGICLINSVRFYRLVIEGAIGSSFPLPLSLVIACFLVLVLLRVVRTAKTSPSRLEGATQNGAAARIAISFVLCAVIFPVAQMFCFGLTDYRRPADAIVVFGAGIGSDGTPSPALFDCVRTGCLLYQQGLAPVLIFSGGNERPTDEPTVMKRLAVEMGVPAAAIVLDPDGLNTDATVNNCRRLLPAMHAARVLTVSHFYHLPRVKMTFARAGIDVCTVPAEQIHPLTALPYYMAREVAALWAYYFRPMKL